MIQTRGLYFDPQWRDLGDFHWVVALLKNQVPMAACDVFTSTFADTGENMNFKPNAIRERKLTDEMTPAWLRPLKPWWIISHRLRRYWAGHFKLRPTSYEIYTKASPAARVKFTVEKPTAVWWNRLSLQAPKVENSYAV